MRVDQRCRAFGLALALVMCGWPASAHATFPGQNGRIAFDTITGEGGGVHVIEADGTGFQRIAPRAEDPAWSADGVHLAYIRGSSFGGLFVSGADGSGEALLRETFGEFGVLHEFRDPAWSSDGGTIAYVWVESRCPPREACVDVPHGIRAIAPDGTGDRALIDPPAGNPSFSPDGTRLAWDVGDGAPDGAIHVSNADGAGDTVLTRVSVNGDGRAWEPSWSPNGSRIAFSRVTGGDTEIYAMNADGTGLTRLTSLPGDDGSPAWSPDGTRIAWSHENALWTMNADGGAPARLFPAFLGLFPDWQPLGPRREDYKNASHFCKAVREFLGAQEFEERYGNHGGCVSGNH